MLHCDGDNTFNQAPTNEPGYSGARDMDLTGFTTLVVDDAGQVTLYGPSWRGDGPSALGPLIIVLSLAPSAPSRIVRRASAEALTRGARPTNGARDA